MGQGTLTFLSMILGGAFLTFLQFLINRHDMKNEKMQSMMDDIKSIKEELNRIWEDIEEDKATDARIRILRFSDEIRHGVRHSKEHFDQTNDDIDDYRTYCNDHPDYENNRSVQAIANIERVYQKCLQENDFLD